MTKNLKGQNGSSVTPINNNSSLGNFYNASGQNQTTDANNTQPKSSEELAEEFAADAGNLGKGLGNLLAKTPIGKGLQKLFGTQKTSSQPSSDLEENNVNAKTNRALLQTANSTQLSYSCTYLINRLNLTDTNKELLTDSTQKLIDEISLKDFEEISKYLSGLEGGDINVAAQALSKNFVGVAKEDIVKLLKEVHDYSPNKGEFISFVHECIKQNPALTHTPTQAPTYKPTQSPTPKPTMAPTPPTNQPTAAPTPQFTSWETLGIGMGGIAAVMICLGCIALAAGIARGRNSERQVAPSSGGVELDEVTIHKTPSPRAATPRASSVESKDPSQQK